MIGLGLGLGLLTPTLTLAPALTWQSCLSWKREMLAPPCATWFGLGFG